MKANEVRVISSKGENLGVIKTGEAIQKARSEEMDLVLVVPNANPPVAKIVEFSKFLYEERKKASSAKAKSKKTDVKEFRLGPTTGEGDIQRFVKRAKGFIEDGDKVKITVKMKGREVMFPEVAFDQIKKIEKELVEVAKLESEPKRMGNMIFGIFVGK
ncbi:MAG TPA: translation initiation factor IF-3 [bacterium]|nr:translation initiation factor IF-3 [bacterium]